MKVFYFFVACFFAYLTAVCAVGPVNTACIEKEKTIAFLETAENILTKARDSFPYCKEYVNSRNESECGKKESLAYIEISKKLISDAIRDFPTCGKPVVIDDKIELKDDKPKDCTEILASGRNESGVYTIWPGETCRIRKPLKVYCDMDTEYGGWTVIQRRGKYPVQQDFNMDWKSYINGFGDLTQEHWLGNENIRVLCHDGCEIRFDLEDETGQKAFAFFKNFFLAKSNYRLTINGYTGTAGDSLTERSNLDFSTRDKGDTERSLIFGGGWWHRKDFLYCNLNGIYKPGKSGPDVVGWWTWKKQHNLGSSEIKVRPK